MKTRWLSIIMIVVIALSFLGVEFVNAAAFTPGNLVVLRAGDGSVSLTGNAVPVFLQEITTTGTPVQTIAVPVVDNGANQILVMAGNATSEGTLNLSADRNYLTFAGYDAPVGTVAVNGSMSATYNRIVARVGSDGVIDTTTRINDAYNMGNIRSAATDDGSRFWTGGNTTTGPDDGTGGTHYVVYGSSGDSTRISTTPVNTRAVKIFKDQLYTTSALGPYIGVNSIGVGLPTSSGQTTTLLSGMPGSSGLPWGFVLFDMDAGIDGVDTLYMADSTNGLRKYSYNGSTWTARGSLLGSAYGLTAMRTGSTIDLYVIDYTGSGAYGGGNRVYKVTDTAAFNANITNNGSNINAGTLLATAGANTAFRGIAFTPGSQEQVDPTAITIRNLAAQSGDKLPLAEVSWVLLAAAAVGLFAWRKKRN